MLSSFLYKSPSFQSLCLRFKRKERKKEKRKKFIIDFRHRLWDHLVFDVLVTLIFPAKFRVNLHFGLRKEVQMNFFQDGGSGSHLRFKIKEQLQFTDPSFPEGKSRWR